MEALRGSSADDFPSAWGHLRSKVCEDAAAARHRNVLLFVAVFALQMMDWFVILIFVEVISVIFLL